MKYDFIILSLHGDKRKTMVLQYNNLVKQLFDKISI